MKNSKRKLNLQKISNFRQLEDFVNFGKLGAAHPNAIATRWKKGDHISPETEFKPGIKNRYRHLNK